MDRETARARLDAIGAMPHAVGEGINKRVEPSVRTCPVCGGYDSVTVPGTREWHFEPELALAYAELADEVRESVGLTPYRQMDRGGCTCGHKHAWEFVRSAGTCLTRYRCTVPGCGVENVVDSSD